MPASRSLDNAEHFQISRDFRRPQTDSIRSLDDVAMTNEALCKILCHNISVLIQEQTDLGITTEFWGEEKVSLPAPTIQDFDFAEFEFVG